MVGGSGIWLLLAMSFLRRTRTLERTTFVTALLMPHGGPMSLNSLPQRRAYHSPPEAGRSLHRTTPVADQLGLWAFLIRQRYGYPCSCPLTDLESGNLPAHECRAGFQAVLRESA